MKIIIGQKGHLPIWKDVQLQKHGEHKGSLYDEDINWDINTNNRSWHKSFFTAKAVLDHQAKANCAMVRKVVRHIKTKYNNENAVILDPMCGIGSMLIMAGLEGHDSVGIEMEDIYYNDLIGYDSIRDEGGLWGLTHHTEGVIEKYDRLTAGIKTFGKISVIQGDARNTDVLIDEYNDLSIVSSPPYGGHTEYSREQIVHNNCIVRTHNYENDANIASLTDDDYEREMSLVYESYARIPNLRVVCLVTRDFIRKGAVVYLSALTIELMWKAGFELIEIIRTRLPEKSMFKVINFRNFHEGRGLPMIDWEEITIYKKG